MIRSLEALADKNINELTKRDRIVFRLKQLYKIRDKFNEWECGFITSLAEKFKAGNIDNLSRAQTMVLFTMWQDAYEKGWVILPEGML